MAKRKFTRIGETPNSYRCTNRKCKWEGKDEEKSRKREGNGYLVHICPNCLKDEFYGLL